MKSSLLIKITAVLMVAVTMFTLASCSLFEDTSADETTTTERAAVALSEKPETTEEIVNYFNTIANNIKASKPGVSVSRRGDVKDIDTGDNDEAEALIKFAESFAEKLEKAEDSREYGSDLNDFLPLAGTAAVSTLTAADVVSAECNNKADSGNDRFYYTINITLNDSDAEGAVSKAFDLDVNKQTVLEEFQSYTDTLEVSGYDVAYNGCTIYVEVNKETDEISYMSYTLNSVVTTTVDFLGELQSLGETEIKFNYQQTIEYKDFVWEAPTEATTVAE